MVVLVTQPVMQYMWTGKWHQTNKNRTLFILSSVATPALSPLKDLTIQVFLYSCKKKYRYIYSNCSIELLSSEVQVSRLECQSKSMEQTTLMTGTHCSPSLLCTNREFNNLKKILILMLHPSWITQILPSGLLSRMHEKLFLCYSFYVFYSEPILFIWMDF